MTEPASSYQELLRTQLLSRTLRLNLQNTSATGSYTVRTEEVGTTFRLPVPRSVSRPALVASWNHDAWASSWYCQGCAGSSRQPSGGTGPPSRSSTDVSPDPASTSARTPRKRSGNLAPASGA